MERVRIEEFALEGKNFMYIDLSDIRTNEEFIEVIKIIEPVVEKYPPRSLYTITNIENVRIDTESKEIASRYMEHNKPYVIIGAVIGLDGIKKILASSIFNLSRRNNMVFAFTKEQAMEMLLKKG